MSETHEARHADTSGRRAKERQIRRRRLILASSYLGAVALLIAIATVTWLGSRATLIKNELEATTQLVPILKEELAENKSQEASATATQLRLHTTAARDAAGDPLWTLASAIPGIGDNFGAIAEVSRSADDVAAFGVVPLVRVFGSLNWDSLLPASTGADLEPLKQASPSVSAAAHAVRASAERLNRIEGSNLLPQVAEPLARVREQLQSATGSLEAAANAAEIAPSMLGADGQRNYLLMIQNNAEVRASGGIPGALAVLTLDNGKLTLGAQTSAGEVGVTSPAVAVDDEQQQIYSKRLGQFMQDVNLTPDFPTAAATAQAMWAKKTGQNVDGVISLDPIALSYILDATGPVKITSPELATLVEGKMPTELNAKNAVSTLLSEVYAKIASPMDQDAYFAGVAKEIFSALSTGKGNAKSLVEGLTRGAEEGRVLLWSSLAPEQSVIAGYPVSGSITGPSVSPTQFGVYFNDGTGAKMDYYVKRTVQLVEECTNTEYGQVKVRVTSTNTAPADAATSLPGYVTGGGTFGVPAGTVQTNVIAYGPVQANMETATVDGRKVSFAAHRHSNRPVGSLTTILAPGQSSTVELTFGKIVQHAEPDLVVTPTVQAVKDVILDTQSTPCAAVR